MAATSDRDVLIPLLDNFAVMDGPIAMFRHTVGSKTLRIGLPKLRDGFLFPALVNPHLLPETFEYGEERLT